MSSTEIVSMPDTAGRRLKVRFFQQADRYAHSVWWVDGDSETILLESVEGDDRAAWPPSPPLQQLTVEDRPDGGRVLLLVGMAGTSHWSLSVEPHPSDPAFLFDVACRIKGECRRLGNQYRCHARPAAPRGPQTIEFGVADQLIRLDSEARGNGPAAPVEISGETVSVHPTPPSARPPTTARWTYRVAIAP